MDKTPRIRELNDRFRKTGFGGRMMLTHGITSLPQPVVSTIIERVQTFDAFTPDNDPHGEHDFGAIAIEDRKVFWKIDYYAEDMMHGSDDPSDSTKTVRVLTIMLASEY